MLTFGAELETLEGWYVHSVSGDHPLLAQVESPFAKAVLRSEIQVFNLTARLCNSIWAGLLGCAEVLKGNRFARLRQAALAVLLAAAVLAIAGWWVKTRYVGVIGGRLVSRLEMQNVILALGAEVPHEQGRFTPPGVDTQAWYLRANPNLRGQVLAELKQRSALQRLAQAIGARPDPAEQSQLEQILLASPRFAGVGRSAVTELARGFALYHAVSKTLQHSAPVTLSSQPAQLPKGVGDRLAQLELGDHPWIWAPELVSCRESSLWIRRANFGHGEANESAVYLKRRGYISSRSTKPGPKRAGEGTTNFRGRTLEGTAARR